jgi:hypothetical protein
VTAKFRHRPTDQILKTNLHKRNLRTMNYVFERLFMQSDNCINQGGTAPLENPDHPQGSQSPAFERNGFISFRVNP